jgi:tetratricopeptide (TPR) repeat protein
MVPQVAPGAPAPSTSTSAPPDGPTGDLIAELTARVTTLEAQARHERPARSRAWYREAATLVSVLALVFSVTATVFTSREASNQNARAARSELGQLIQRLSALPKENAELVARYADDRAVLTTLSGLISSENVVLAQQAADVADRIPNQVSGSEYLAVAMALELSGDYPRSLRMIDRGLKVESNPNTREGLLRMKGRIYFGLGQIEAGRDQLRAALAVWADGNVQARERGHAYTQLTWSVLERQAGNCPQALAHYGLAQQAVAQLTEGPLKSQLVKNLQASAVTCGTAG